MKQEDVNRFIISADIGGSHIVASVVDMKTKSLVNETRVRTFVDSNGTALEILEGWAATIAMSAGLGNVKITQLALAMPGPFDYENGISYITGLHKYELLYAINVKHFFARHFNIAHENIVFRNDAEAFLHGEVLNGAGKGFDNVIGFTLGTGLGSARSIMGVTKDLNWGCVAYKASIADDHFSTRWFLKRYEELSSVKCMNVKEFVGLADTDLRVAQVFDEFADNFAGFIADFLQQSGTDCIVLGGNIAHANQLFLKRLSLGLSSHLASSKIKIALLGEDAALIGAAFTFQPADRKG